MSIHSLADFFTPQDRKQGEDLFDNDVVYVANSSDAEARTYVKRSGSPRVSFIADDISSPHFQANCTCPAAKKGKLCKDIWASILKLEATESDFLACKTFVEKAAAPAESEASLAAKARQAEYKQRYKEKSKARSQELRLSKKRAMSMAALSYPEDVEMALKYFSSNGFEFSHPPELVEVDAARKSLAHVFHPDKGGTHSEILMLNKNYDVIVSYIRS